MTFFVVRPQVDLVWSRRAQSPAPAFGLGVQSLAVGEADSDRRDRLGVSEGAGQQLLTGRAGPR